MVSNRGNGPSTGTTIRYYLSADYIIPEGDIEIGNSAIDPLGAIESQTKRFASSLPARPGTYYYGACVDPVSGEANRHNNCSVPARVVVGETSPVRIKEETRCSWRTLPFTEFKLEGTVEATQSVSSVTVKGFVSFTGTSAVRQRFLAGQQDLGSMSANETKSFSIATTGPADFSPIVVTVHGCDYELEWEP